MLAGHLKYESLLDRSVGLYDVALLNDAVDVFAYNAKAMRDK